MHLNGGVWMNAFRYVLAAGAAALSLTAASHAQMVGDAIVATVNDTPISTFDVQQRMRLMQITMGRQIPEEAQAQYRNQALRELIEEELKRQEATRREILATEGDVDQELARIASSGGSSIQGLAAELARNGIAIEKLREKIHAEISWDTLVRARYRARVSVSEGEIDDMLDEMKAEKQAEQYLLSEICLPIDTPQNREQVYNIGMQMLGQMQQGVPFQALAQRFSSCPSAARGGDLGWMRRPELDGQVAEIIPRLSEGNVSTPIETSDGEMMKLVAIRQKREAAERGDPAYELAYAGVPKRIYSRAQAEEKLKRLPLTGPCSGDGLSTDLGEGIGVELLPMVPITQIREPFQDAIIDLQRGDTSELMESTNNYHVVYVCEMDEGLGLPRRRMVENRLEAQQFDLLSRRYLRDVERDSDVDIRIGGPDQQQDS